MIDNNKLERVISFFFIIFILISAGLIVMCRVAFSSFVEEQCNSKQWLLYESNTDLGSLRIVEEEGSATIRSAIVWYLDDQKIKFTNDYNKAFIDTISVDNLLIVTEFYLKSPGGGPAPCRDSVKVKKVSWILR